LPEELVGLQPDKFLKQNRHGKKCESIIKKPVKRHACALSGVKRLELLNIIFASFFSFFILGVCRS